MTRPTPPRPWAVFDIDGVVADVRHRVPHLHQPTPDWEAFFGAAEGDLPLAEGVELVAEYSTDHALVWLTGRPERIRGLTTAWLARHRLPHEHLVMRPDGDDRPASVLKARRLAQLALHRPVAVVVDDDPRVVSELLDGGWPVHRATWALASPPLHYAQERLGRT